jgi:hypothetical protein
MNKLWLVPILSILISISCIILVINTPKGNFIAIGVYIFLFFPVLSLFQIIVVLLSVRDIKLFNKLPRIILFFNILITTIFIYITLAYMYGTS